MERPLLEWVYSKTQGMSPELEEIWMEWYDYHQLMMCRMPGWTWNYRLMNLIGPEKYVSLYRVEDYEALKLIEGWPRVDQGKMDPITDNLDPAALQDWEEKVRRGLQDTGKFTFTGGASDKNPLDQGHWGWRYLAGAALDDPLLKSNNPLGTELISVSRENDARWKAWYEAERFPALQKLPGVLMAGWYGITTKGREFEPGYNYIAIFELESEDAAFRLGDPEQRIPEAKAFWEDPAAEPYYALTRDVRTNYYKPISRHWGFQK